MDSKGRFHIIAGMVGKQFREEQGKERSITVFHPDERTEATWSEFCEIIAEERKRQQLGSELD